MQCWVRTNYLRGQVAVCWLVGKTINSGVVSEWPPEYIRAMRAGILSREKENEATQHMHQLAHQVDSVLRAMGHDVGAIESLC